MGSRSLDHDPDVEDGDFGRYRDRAPDASADDRALRERLTVEVEPSGLTSRSYVNIVVRDGVVHVFRSRVALGAHQVIWSRGAPPRRGDQVLADPPTDFDETTERAFRVRCPSMDQDPEHPLIW